MDDQQKEKPGIIVQARMTSTRLPGKVLQPVYTPPEGNYISMLEAVVMRLQRCQEIPTIIIATTVNETDDPVVHLCEKLGIPVFRGSEDYVLERYYLAAKEHGLTTVIRVTSDCPVIDPLTIDKMYRFYRIKSPKYDYVSNLLERTYPRGLDAEVFSFQALEKAYLEATLALEHEHVTAYIYRHPERFSLYSYRQDDDWSQFRLTVDTEDDLRLIQQIYQQLYPLKPDFNQFDLIKFLVANPELAESNAHIEQKVHSNKLYDQATTNN